MALFGRKAKDAAPDPTASNGAGAGGGVAVADAANGTDAAPGAKKGKRVKAVREPKPTKNKTVKNGVAVGLNIGNQFIKAVEVTSKNGELSVTAMGAVATPPESYVNGNVLSVSSLSNAIKDLWRTAGIKSKVVITSVAGTGALVVRVIEVPKMTDGELRDNMKVDADRYIPFPPSEVVMDFKALRDLPSDPDAPNMEVLLAAAQREIIDLHIKVVQSAKLDPRAIDVEPIAATRSLQLERRGGDNFIDYNDVTAVVNLGATGAEISILRGDIVVFTRAVPNGGNAVTQAIADGLGLPFNDAEHLKIQSADALAPAGYGAANEDFGFGDSGDFDFGGDEFSGGDFNQAFNDITANPGEVESDAPTAAPSDDPFDLDFFNQTPKQNEPGAGHAQKEDEPPADNPAPAFSFDFGGLDDMFAAPATPPTPAEESPAAASTAAPLEFAFPDDPQPEAPAPATTPTAQPSPSTAFDFAGGFDDEFLPSIDTEATPTEPAAPTTGADKRTSQLDDFSFDAGDTTPLPPLEATAPVAPPIPTSPVVSEGFSAAMPSMPSAFDFDNFDLPAASSQPVTAVPIPPAPLAATPPPAPVVPATPPSSPAPPADNTPITFDFDDANLASQVSNDPTPAPDFGFSLDKPPAAPPVPPATPPVQPAPAPASDEFDLDSIFGAPAVEPVSAPEPATGAISLEKNQGIESSDDLDFGDLAATPAAMPAASSASATPSEGDFDLTGIDTGLGDNFGAAFGNEADDFTAFGAGLVEGTGASTDAATLYGLIYGPLEELSNEVRRSLEFHLGRYPDATISRLVLLGGGSKLRNLDVFFTQMLGVPTTVANPFAHIALNAPKLPPDYATENGPLCAVALGLALRDFVD